MAAKGYTTKTQIENYGLITIDASFDDQIDDWISSIEAFIDNFTGRSFVAGSVEEERLFDGDGSDTLLIDDALLITAIEFSDEELDEDAVWYEYPANDFPKTKIVYAGIFPLGNQNIKIIGTFGFSTEAPDDIQLAATVLVTGIITYGKAAGKGDVRSKTIGRYTVAYSTAKGWQDFNRAMGILNGYKRFSF